MGKKSAETAIGAVVLLIAFTLLYLFITTVEVETVQEYDVKAAERSNRAANRKELSETTWYPHSCNKNARLVFGQGEPGILLDSRHQSKT